MFKVKIYGAGSIGNHLANASRVMGWDVTVCDTDTAALERMRKDIYPTRYGSWDTSIKTYTNDTAPKGNYDFILIGTPPDSHIPLAFEALKEKPKAIMLEKPACGPELAGLDEFYRLAKSSGVRVYVGYTHVVSRSMREFEKLCQAGVVGDVQTFDVEFREHWGGIFKAHPWLKGPEDTYLGFWKSGGGAAGEHSHAANLWQHLSHLLGFGRVTQVTASINYRTEGKTNYDDLCLYNLQTEKGIMGRVVQDVLTAPSKKVAFVQGTKGNIEWFANYDSTGDAIVISRQGQAKEVLPFPKKRPDDFITELQHFDADLKRSESTSPLILERGLDTMLVLAAGHESQKRGARVKINYDAGYRLAALS